MDWGMLSEGDREGVLRYATTLCNAVTETLTTMSQMSTHGGKGLHRDKGSDEALRQDKGLNKAKDKGQEKDKDKVSSFYSPLSPAAAIACLSQLHALGVRWTDLTAHPPLITAIHTLALTLAANDRHHHRHQHDHDEDENDNDDDRRWRRYSLSLETVLQGMGAVTI